MLPFCVFGNRVLGNQSERCHYVMMYEITYNLAVRDVMNIPCQSGAIDINNVWLGTHEMKNTAWFLPRSLIN